MSGTRRKVGPLSPVVDRYRTRLTELGYTAATIREMVKVLGQIDRWMIDNDLAVADLSSARMTAFMNYRIAGECRRAPNRPVLAVLVQLLTDLGLVTAPAPTPLNGVESLLSTYRAWLIDDRGLAPSTVSRYENSARRFVTNRASMDGQPNVSSLTGAQVSDFLLADARRYSVGAMKGRVAELRALLRYLYVRGFTANRIGDAVPPVAGWRDASIPRYLPQGDVESIVGSCDRLTALGVRDFAMILLLARLGLRSIEVSRLELDDINWRSGELKIRGKARRIDTMPLPAEVGDAVATYLRDVRPHTLDRHVFQTYRAPIRAVPPDLLSDVVRRACVRAGLAPSGAHRLRHSLATGMLAQGVSLIDISAVLRHQDLATTAIYAKVDLISLRAIAQPWPGLAR